MPAPVEGAAKLTDDNVTVKTETQVDDATIKAMAEKSGDSEDHIRKMLGLAENGQAAQSAEEKLLAGKYKTEEDLQKGFNSLVEKYGIEKAYKMLEQGMGKADDTGKQDEDASAGEAGDEAGKADGEKDALSGDDPEDSGDEDPTSGIDFDKFGREFSEKGELSEASYKELEAAGLSKEMVDQYIAGAQAQYTLFQNDLLAKAGGEDQYNAMIEWAADNLKDAEKERFNNAIAQMDTATADIMLEALKARYEKANGSFRRKMLEGSEGDGDARGAVGYASHQQFQEDIRDPRYQAGDKAFHARVKAKLKATTVF
jgi:hypothetical protein